MSHVLFVKLKSDIIHSVNWREYCKIMRKCLTCMPLGTFFMILLKLMSPLASCGLEMIPGVPGWPLI